MKVRALIIVAVLLAFAGSAWAVTPVDCSVAGVSLVPLNSFTSWGEFRPRDVAVSPSGKVFATDFLNDKVTVFGRDGKVVKFINKSNPYGITADNTGNVYIGWAEGASGFYKGQVDIYDESLNSLGSLGAGWGEFQLPYSIAADDTRVFVADNRANMVKVYDKQTLQLLTSFGGLCSNPGCLVMPTGVAVTADGTIYVSDAALEYDSQGGYGMGAGAHIFTIDANNTVTFVKRFVTFGFESDGALYLNASGISVDNDGHVLVADSAKGDFQVFDADGNYICSKQIEAYTMFPRGMEVSSEGKLIVAAHDRVYQYGIGQFTDLKVSPTSLVFNAQTCVAAPASQNITITNNGAITANWTASEAVSWLNLSATSGSVANGGSDTIAVSVNTAGLSTGSYTGIIQVSGTGMEEYIVASLVVSGPPTFTAAPESFSFTVVGTDIPSSESLDVNGSGWTSTAPAWISLSPSQASGSHTVASVGVDASALAGMAGGDYSGVITLDTGCSLVPPVDIAVSLSYVKGGSIEISTNNPDATFTISGPETYEGSGTSFSADGVAEGAYAVSFGAVTGFKTPDSVNIQVVNGETATVDGEYLDLRESNTIIIGGASIALDAANEVAVYETNGTLSNTFIVEKPVDNSQLHGRVSAVTTSGDFDGDGVDEIVVAHDEGVITGYESDGTPMIGFDFRAYQDVAVVDLASGDFDGDGTDELVVGAGSAKNTDAAVRVFSYTGGSVVDTGVYFLASAARNGVEVAAGDVNGDGTDEIVTAAIDQRSASLRTWTLNASAGMGAWSAAGSGGFSVSSVNGLDIAVGDLNADGQAEVVIALSSKDGASIAAYGATGNSLGGFALTGMTEVFVATGDTDLDGTAEIVVSSAIDRNPVVKIYRSDGTFQSEFNTFTNTDTKGARVSLGQVVAR